MRKIKLILWVALRVRDNINKTHNNAFLTVNLQDKIMMMTMMVRIMFFKF